MIDQAFLDKLKVDAKLVAVEHLLSQLNVRPGLDFSPLRSKIEELFREGLGINPTGYLEMINNLRILSNSLILTASEMIKGKAITDEIKNWSPQTLQVMAEKYLEVGKHADLVAFLKTHHEKLSTIKITDLLKRVLILENDVLASGLVRASLETRHKETLKNKEVIDMLASLKDLVEVEKFVAFYVFTHWNVIDGIVSLGVRVFGYEEIVSSVNYMTTGQHSLEGLAKPRSSPVAADIAANSPASSKQEVLKLGTSSAGEVLLCILDHDDWVVFRKLYQHFREDQLVDDASLKRIISVLVEKQQLETLRFVVSFTLKDTYGFMRWEWVRSPLV